MKEIISIINAYNQIDLTATKAALATVVGVQGSSYRRTGARMLVLDNGVSLGGISGGCLEGDALRRSQIAIFKNKPSIVTYDTTQNDAHQIGVGLGCNGIIDVLITPLNNQSDNPVNLLSQISDTREPRVLVSIIEAEEEQGLLGKTILFTNEEKFISSFPLQDISQTVVKDILHAMENNSSATIIYDSCKGAIKIFIEVILPPIHLAIYGSNYDVLPVVTIAKQLGWSVTLVTDVAKANKQLIETAENIIDAKSHIQPAFDGYSAAVLMSHDYKTDLNNVKKILHTQVSYIGLLGPKKRSDKMFNELANENFLIEKYIEKIYAPCGLDIGAANPEEIALSVIAEIKAHFSKRKGTSLKFRQGSIYERAVQ